MASPGLTASPSRHAGARRRPHDSVIEHVCERSGVGSNRRYPEAGTHNAYERRLQAARAQGPLRTLTEDQLQLATRVVSLAPERGPMWARAWLRFGDTDIRCTVLVKRWTADAVGVELEVGEERLRCWVWQGAVEHVDGPTPP